MREHRRLAAAVLARDVAPFAPMALEDTFSSYTVVVHEGTWQALSADQRAALARTAADGCEWASREAAAELDALAAKMTASGGTITTIDTGPLRRISAEVGQKMESEGVWTAGLLQKIQAI